MYYNDSISISVTLSDVYCVAWETSSLSQNKPVLAFLSLLFVFYSYLYSFVSYCCPLPTCCLFYLAFTPVFVDRIILFVTPFILKRMASSLPGAIVCLTVWLLQRDLFVLCGLSCIENHTQRGLQIRGFVYRLPLFYQRQSWYLLPFEEYVYLSTWLSWHLSACNRFVINAT